MLSFTFDWLLANFLSTNSDCFSTFHTQKVTLVLNESELDNLSQCCFLIGQFSLHKYNEANLTS